MTLQNELPTLDSVADERDQYKDYGKSIRRLIGECLRKEPDEAAGGAPAPEARLHQEGQGQEVVAAHAARAARLAQLPQSEARAGLLRQTAQDGGRRVGVERRGARGRPGRHAARQLRRRRCRALAAPRRHRAAHHHRRRLHHCSLEGVQHLNFCVAPDGFAVDVRSLRVGGLTFLCLISFHAIKID